MRIYKTICLVVMLGLLGGCQENSWRHSAAIVVKGVDVRMTMYGDPYNAITDWKQVRGEILDHVIASHSQKLVLIRILPAKKKSALTDYAVRKVAGYFRSHGVRYEIRDERPDGATPNQHIR